MRYTKTTKTPLFSFTVHDCEVQTFRSGGKGGQNQNKVESGVRIIHHPSGAVGESRETRSQLENKRRAFMRMGTSLAFQKWAKLKALGLEDLEKKVDQLMEWKHLKVEVFGPDGWIEVKDGRLTE